MKLVKVTICKLKIVIIIFISEMPLFIQQLFPI